MMEETHYRVDHHWPAKRTQWESGGEEDMKKDNILQIMINSKYRTRGREAHMAARMLNEI